MIRAMVKKILCLIGFHDYKVHRCTGRAIYGSSLWDWFADDNFAFKCIHCGKERIGGK